MSEMRNEENVPVWTLGDRLEKALHQAGITTAEMAEELDVSRSTISRWMNGHGAVPKKLYVRQWATRTRVSVQWLTTGETDGRTTGQ